MELKITNLSFNYGNIPILHGINFEAKQGQIVGIIGPNGSGKTTLLRCIAKILQPEQGQVLIDEKAIQFYTNTELAKIISVVPQISSFAEGFTVFETVLMGRYPHLGVLRRETQKDYEIVHAAIERVRISHLTNRDVSELSGGEKQLVSIALALAQEPKLLCLDEPTLHLDISMQYMIMDLCREISQDKQIGVLVVLHDLTLATQYCDQLIILKNGKVSAKGAPDEVITEEIISDTYNVNVTVGKDTSTGLKYILPTNSRKILENHP